VAGGDAPGADDGALFAAAARWLAARGAEVRLFADADNCVRPREPGEAVAAGGDAARLPFVVEVQGFPNLVHELAHVVLLGRVAKDHATAAAAIPFDLGGERGRALFLDELACCVASCAWHHGPDAATTAWFDEQVAIQPCFFRGDGDLRAFLRDADAAIARDPAACVATCGRAHDGVRDALVAGGLAASAAAPRRRFEPLEQWRTLVRRLSAT